MPVVLGGLLQRVLKIAKQMIHLECQMLSQPLWCIVPRVCVYLIKHFYFLYFSLSLCLSFRQALAVLSKQPSVQQ